MHEGNLYLSTALLLGISSKALPTIFQRRVVVSTVGSTVELPVSTLVCHIISSTALYFNHFNRALRRRNFLIKHY